MIVSDKGGQNTVAGDAPSEKQTIFPTLPRTSPCQGDDDQGDIRPTGRTV